MKRFLCVFLLVFGMVGTASAAEQFAFEASQAISWFGGHPGAVIDDDGNMHIVSTGNPDCVDATTGWCDEPQIWYLMVAPNGDLLINYTMLTTGGTGSTDKNKPFPVMTDDGKVLVVYHHENDDLHLMVLNPSAHPQNGTVANATATTPAADGGNTGDGEMSPVATAAGATRTENWTVEYDGSEWTVTGSVSGELDEKLESSSGFYPEPDDFDTAPVVAFEITDGGTAWESGDKFTFSTTASVISDVRDTEEITPDDGIESVAPRVHNLGGGDFLIMWREVDPNSDFQPGDSAAIKYMIGDPASKAFGSIQTLYEAEGDHYLPDYGGTWLASAVDGNGLHVAFSEATDDTVSYVERIAYEVVDPSSNDVKVDKTAVFINEYTRKHDVAPLPDGNVMIAGQSRLSENGDNDDTRMFYGIVNPSANGFDGSALVEVSGATADGGNAGDGTVEELETSLAAPAGTVNWTLTCTDDTTAGSEVWSVENDATDAPYADATTGIYYFSDNGDLTFLIDAGGADFADGDTFTFTTTNNAMVRPIELLEPTDNLHHPKLYVDPNGAGIMLLFVDKGENGDDEENEVYYAMLGYDGTVLDGPTKLSDVDFGDDRTMEWMYMPVGGFHAGKVMAVWAEQDTGDSYNYAVVGMDDAPVSPPSITSVDPAEFTEGAGGTLTIEGENFVDGAVVLLGDEALTTTFGSATELTAEVPTTVAVGTYDVGVVNPDTLFDTESDAVEVVAAGDDDDSDDDVDDDDSDDDASDDDVSGDDDDDDDDDGCCGC